MITEDYISFDTAKLLTQKCFEVKYDGYYNEAGSLVDMPNSILLREGYQYYGRSTVASVIKWLREKCGCIISIEYQPIATTFKWRIYKYDQNTDDLKKHINFQHYESYKECAEDAIKYCLEGLI